MSEKNEARSRIWNDDAAFEVVSPDSVPDGNVRFSDDALKVLREQGAAAYEEYVASKTK